MKHCALSCLLLAGLCAIPAIDAQTPPPTPPPSATILASSVCGAGATYDQLTSASRPPAPPQTFPGGTAPIELTITSAEFNDRLVDAKTAASEMFCMYSSTYLGVEVSSAGEIYSFMSSSTAEISSLNADMGGGGGKLAADDFSRLESLMNDLPADGHRVPPIGRRILVTVDRNGTHTVRLYDSSNLPDAIVDMIGLTGSRIKFQFQAFHPDRILSPEEASSLDQPPPPKRRYQSLNVSPDRSLGVLHDFSTKTLTVYQGSTWPQAGLPTDGKILRVIQEFWQPDTYGGYWVDSERSPDGRYLLVTWGMRIGALLYDTSTWQPVTDPNIFPQRLKEYLHTPDWNLAVAVNEAGETLVWDWQSHRILSEFPGLGGFEPPPEIHDQQGRQTYTTPSAQIQSAVFSPDRTRVAIFSAPGNKPGLSIWDIQTGKKLRDVSPASPSSAPGGMPLLWWNGDRWLLYWYANGVGLWDTETGRLKGTLDLTGCDLREAPTASGSKLLQSCFQGKDQPAKVQEWSVDGITKQMDSAARQIAGASGTSK